jgi:type VI secretion system protein ImpC
MLLRLPYGADTEPVDPFEFEEMPSPPVNEDYLWGNPAVPCACLLGQAFTEAGGAFEAGDYAQLDGLPVHAYKVDGESTMTPCAEYWLTETEAERLAGNGLIPVCSIRGRDAVMVFRFQSLAGRRLSFGG